MRGDQWLRRIILLVFAIFSIRNLGFYKNLDGYLEVESFESKSIQPKFEEATGANPSHDSPGASWSIWKGPRTAHVFLTQFALFAVELYRMLIIHQSWTLQPKSAPVCANKSPHSDVPLDCRGRKQQPGHQAGRNQLWFVSQKRNLSHQMVS